MNKEFFKFPISIIPSDTKIDFLKKKFVAFLFSAILTLYVLISLMIQGLNFGIDFTGGLILEVRFDSEVNLGTIRHLLSRNDYHGASITQTNLGDVVFKLQLNQDADHEAQINKIKSLIIQHLPNPEFRRIDYVGPKMGKELINKAVMAVLFSLAFIMCYVAFRFNWSFGIGILIALLHDAIITLGFYVVSKFEFDLTSIAALLTVIGYSVNDSVVIYDRIRENQKKYSSQKKGLSYIINLSINETLSRTIMTVLTTLIVCLALVIFGGEFLRGMSAAMFFGIAFGTYSSIYISAPILVLIEQFTTKQKAIAKKI